MPSSAISSSTTSAPPSAHRRNAHARSRGAAPAQLVAQRLRAVADVGDDEDVEHHHRAGVHDDLHGGDEFRAQQQKQHGQRDQVRDEREHAVEGVAQQHHAERAGDRAERGEEEKNELILPPSRRRL